MANKPYEPPKYGTVHAVEERLKPVKAPKAEKAVEDRPKKSRKKAD